MQLDQRRDYSRQALAGYLTQESVPKDLDELRWPLGFYKKGLEGRLHYALAKCVVGAWLQGGADLDALIRDVGWFESFPSARFEPFRESCVERL